MGEGNKKREEIAMAAKLSEELLKYMRSPQELIDSVKETIALEARAVISTIEIQFSAQRRSQYRYRYIDVLHPDKGVPVDISLNSDDIQIASHEEHIRVARDAISYRYTSITKGVLITANSSVNLKAVHSTLGKIKQNLEKIPSLPPVKALEIFHKYFTDAGEAKWIQKILKVKGVESVKWTDKEAMRSLFRLCKRLSRKYLLLLKIPTSRPSVSQNIKLTVERPYDSQTSSGNSPTIRHRYALFGSIPTAFRYHTPWAKKTNHYLFTVRAPKGQFFSRADVVTRKQSANDSQSKEYIVLQPQTPVKFSWATSLNQGNKVNFFVGHGRKWPEPIYISLTHRELPGRSLLRSLSLTITALLLMIAFFMAMVILGMSLGQTAPLILALLALGGIASPWPKAAGPLGIPLLSRVTPGFVAANAVGYALWIVYYEKSWQSAADRAIGLVFIFLVMAFLVRLLYRARNQARDFKHSVAAEPVFGGTFQ